MERNWMPWLDAIGPATSQLGSIGLGLQTTPTTGRHPRQRRFYLFDMNLLLRTLGLR